MAALLPWKCGWYPVSSDKVVPIYAILNTYWADLGDNRYAAIKGKTGNYIELIDTPPKTSDAKLGFFPCAARWKSSWKLFSSDK